MSHPVLTVALVESLPAWRSNESPWLGPLAFHAPRNAAFSAWERRRAEADAALSSLRSSPISRNPDGTLRGWRAWEIGRDASGPWHLMPLSSGWTREVTWAGPMAAASCSLGCRSVVTPECSCGLHAFARREVLALAVVRDSLPACAIGEIAAWGRVAAHDQGFRAELAQVRTIEVSSTTPARVATSLQRHYGVRVTVHHLDLPENDLEASIAMARERAVRARRLRDQRETP